MNNPTTITSIISASIAALSVILLVTYEIKRRIDNFEDIIFNSLSCVSAIIYDLFEISSNKKITDYIFDIEKADADITKGFRRIQFYGKTHHNRFLINLSSISVEDKFKRKCYSRYLTKLSQNYLTFRKSLDPKNFVYEDHKDKIDAYVDIFRNFSTLLAKHTRTTLCFPRLFFFRRFCFYKELRDNVDYAYMKGIGIYEEEYR